jgi:hypothetical protein
MVYLPRHDQAAGIKQLNREWRDAVALRKQFSPAGYNHRLTNHCKHANPLFREYEKRDCVFIRLPAGNLEIQTQAA